MLIKNGILLEKENIRWVASELIRRQRLAMEMSIKEEALTAMYLVQELYLFLDVLDQDLIIAVREEALKMFREYPYEDKHNLGYIVGGPL